MPKTTAKKARLLPEDWEKIMLHHVFGKPNTEIAEMIGVSDQVVSKTIKVFDLVKAEEWDKLCEVHRVNNLNMNLTGWCLEKTGKEMPAEIKDRLEEISKEWRMKDAVRQGRATPEQQPKEEPAANNPNDSLFMIKILERLAKLEEEHEQLMDVVIPKYFNDLKDNINANTDVTCERLKEIALILEKIAKNTRPRGM